MEETSDNVSIFHLVKVKGGKKEQAGKMTNARVNQTCITHSIPCSVTQMCHRVMYHINGKAATNNAMSKKKWS